MATQEQRSQQTKAQIIDAFVACCKENGYFKTTVSAICARADVHKSTFYRYFGSKDVLLREMEGSYVRDILDMTRSLSAYDPNAPAEEQGRGFEELVRTLQYHYDHREVFLFLMSYSGDPYFRRIVTKACEDYVQAGLALADKSFPENDRYVEYACAQAFVSLLERWLKDGKRTPRQMAGLIWNVNRFFVVYPPRDVVRRMFIPDFGGAGDPSATGAE